VTIYEQPLASPHPRCLFAINPRPPIPCGTHSASTQTAPQSANENQRHLSRPPPESAVVRSPWSPLCPPATGVLRRRPPHGVDGEHPVLPRDAPPFKGWEGSASVSAHSSSSVAPCSLEKKRDLQERRHGV
jgi:hypothetical protein